MAQLAEHRGDLTAMICSVIHDMQHDPIDRPSERLAFQILVLNHPTGILRCRPLLESLKNGKPAIAEFRERWARFRIRERGRRSFHSRQPNTIGVIDVLKGLENTAVRVRDFTDQVFCGNSGGEVNKLFRGPR